MTKTHVLADIQYDIFNRIDGKTTIINTGYIDRTKIYQELLKFNIGLLQICTIDGDVIPIPCDKIHWIEYNVEGYPVHIDCSEFFGKTYDSSLGRPIDISDVKQPRSTLERDRKKDPNRICYPKRQTRERHSWYENNILKKD